VKTKKLNTKKIQVLTSAFQVIHAFKQKPNKSVRAYAKEWNVKDIEHVDGMVFYHFSDGSVVGTKGRGRGHQMWGWNSK
jgi:hypothetical protein